MVEKKLDGGWGWVVTFGSSIVIMFVVGIDFTLGPFFVELQRYYQASSADISWIMSLGSALKLCVGPLAGCLSRRFGVRPVVITVGVLSTIGYILCSFSTSVVYLYFVYGVFTASSLGIAFAPTVSLIGEYFHEKYALANGLAFIGTGIGGFALTLVFQATINQYGWRGSYIILAGLNAHIIACAALFQPPPQREPQPQERPINNVPAGSKTEFLKCIDFALFREFPTYTLILVSEWLLSVGLYSTSVHLAPRAVFLGMTANQAALIVSVFGIAGTVGRLHGFIVDKNYVSAINLYRMATFLAGAASLCSPLLENFSGSVVQSAILGFCCGIYLPLFSVIFREIVGQERLVTAFGIGTFVMATGVLIAPPMAGWIFDTSGNYHISFCTAGAFFLASASVTMVKNIGEKCQTAHGEKHGDEKREKQVPQTQGEDTYPVPENSNTVPMATTVHIAMATGESNCGGIRRPMASNPPDNSAYHYESHV